jgi:hypothetical protein
MTSSNDRPAVDEDLAHSRPPRLCPRRLRRHVHKRIQPTSLSMKSLPRDAAFKAYEDAEETRLNIESKSNRGQDETSQSSGSLSLAPNTRSMLGSCCSRDATPSPPPNQARKPEVGSHPGTANSSSVRIPSPVKRSVMARGA